jgi:acetylornithine deacetylase/succinyl-diaminopimelate desuccinylase-like protein
VAGLVHGHGAGVDYPEETLRADSGILDGVRLVGTGPLAARLWTRPALTVIGIDAPPVATASNTLVPSARAKVSMRIAPGQDPKTAFEALSSHLREHAEWGAQVEVVLGEMGHAFTADVDSPAYTKARWALEQAWGVPPVDIGIGGSIPFVADLAAVYPRATVLVTGIEDPDARAHGANESLHLGEFERACLAEALLLAALGE